MKNLLLANITLLALIYFLNVASISADIIKQDGITIESDKSVYYCEPIYNEKGECLIRATITVTNDNPDQSFNIYNSYSTEVKKEPVKVDGLALISESRSAPLQTNIIKEKVIVTDKPMEIDLKAETLVETDMKVIDPTAEPITQEQKEDFIHISPLGTVTPQEILILRESKPKIFAIEFWAKKSGKFDVQISTDKDGIIILDPVYNITTNSTTPSYYLVNGTARNGSISSFASATDVYPALSDNNASTNFHTQFGGLIYPAENIAYYSFNEYLPTTILHEYSSEHDGYIVGSVSSVPGSYYAGMNFDGNDFVVVDDSQVPSHFNFVDNFSMCAKIAMNDTTERYIMNKQSSGDGFLMRVTGTGQPSCTIDGVTGSRTVTATSGAASAVDNGAFHIICCVYSSPNTILYVDAIQRDIVTTTAGAVANTEDFYIGSGHLGSTFRFVGNIMELALWNRSFSATDVLNLNGTAVFNDFTKADTLDPFFNHTTSCTTCSYYLAVTSQTDDITSVQVMSYLNHTDVNQTNFLRTNILTGQSFINISSLINPTYNLPFRLWSIIGDSQSTISELHLLEVGNDTVLPNISNCFINDTDITCGESTRAGCVITEDVGIYSAYIGVNVTTFGNNSITWFQLNSLSNGTYYTDATYFDQLPIPIEFDLFIVNATDVGGNTITYDPNIQANYTCLLGCTPSWIANDTACFTNDTFFREYYDENNCSNMTGLPPDNGTYIPCNYCMENLVATPSGDCVSSIQNVTWTDTNYYGCCIITSIVSDCSVLYLPYNETGFINCTLITTDFEMQMDSLADFGIGTDKVSGKIWLNDTNGTFTCLSYVKTTDGSVVQTNPTYSKRTDSTIAFTQREIEDREFFVTQQGIANVYWTNRNLVIDGRGYVFGVECSGNSQHLISEKLLTVGYKSVNAPTTRYFWVGENIVPIILGIVFFVAIAILIGYLYKKVKYG